MRPLAADDKASTTTTSTTTTTTTPAPSSTTPEPIPTPKPIEPTSANLQLNITDAENTVCALFNFVATVEISQVVNGTKKGEATVLHLLDTTVVNQTLSSCTSNLTTLVLNINGSSADTLTLQLSHIGYIYNLSQIELGSKQLGNYLTTSDPISKIDDSKSYLCSANSEFELPSVVKENDKRAYLSFKDLKIDAFGSNYNTTGFRQRMYLVNFN